MKTNTVTRSEILEVIDSIATFARSGLTLKETFKYMSVNNVTNNTLVEDLKEVSLSIEAGMSPVYALSKLTHKHNSKSLNLFVNAIEISILNAAQVESLLINLSEILTQEEETEMIRGKHIRLFKNKKRFVLQEQFIEFVNLLSLVVPSSENLKEALTYVCERQEGEISEAFKKALLEMNHGLKTKEALRRITKKVDLPELNTFISQIIQSETFGVGIENTVKIHALKVRKMRRLLAEIESRKVISIF